MKDKATSFEKPFTDIHDHCVRLLAFVLSTTYNSVHMYVHIICMDVKYFVTC